MRRPSPALVVALIALFVALGGPAHAVSLISGSQIAKNSITSKQVRNRSLATKDLSGRAVRQLRVTPAGSITQSKLANGAVTSAKIGGAAITGAKIASNSIGPIQVTNHSLTATDIARFAGTFTASVTATHGQCWEQERRFPGIDITNDIVYVMPGSNWPRQQLGFTVVGSPHTDGFIISGCNRSAMQNVTNVPVVFRYIVFQLN